MSDNQLMVTANGAATGAVAGVGLAMAMKPSEQAIQKETALLLKPIEDAFVKEGSRLIPGSKTRIIDSLEKKMLNNLETMYNKDGTIREVFQELANRVGFDKASKKEVQECIKSFTSTLKKDPKVGKEIFAFCKKNADKIAKEDVGKNVLKYADFKKLSKETQDFVKNMVHHGALSSKEKASMVAELLNGSFVNKLEKIVNGAKNGVKTSYNNIKNDVLNSNSVKEFVSTKIKFKNAGKFAAIGAAIMAVFALITSSNKTK